MKANNEEITEVETDEWYMRRMNTGLAHLQDICYCLAWLIMEDDGVSIDGLNGSGALPDVLPCVSKGSGTRQNAPRQAGKDLQRHLGHSQRWVRMIHC